MHGFYYEDFNFIRVEFNPMFKVYRIRVLL